MRLLPLHACCMIIVAKGDGSMEAISGRARAVAAVIALVAWAGLAIQFSATFNANDAIAETLWILLRYFTVWTNVLVAIVLTGAAFGIAPFGSPRMLGFITLSILLVGIVYVLLLRGLLELSGGAMLADIILHQIVPVLVPLFWLFLAPKGGLGKWDPWLWLIFPLVYLAYALARGAAEGRYAYPFMDAAKLGWSQTATNCLAIGVGFLLAGYAFIWLDRQLARSVRAGLLP